MAAGEKIYGGVKLTEDSNKHLSEQGSKVCKFCRIQVSKYTCPKCYLYYCGLDCYRSERHLKCSESFYRENVMGELKTLKSTDRMRKQTLAMLKRIEKQELKQEEHTWEDEGTSESLGKRMEGLDLDTASFDEMFYRLTEKEKRLFDSILLNGEVEVDELCTPWWVENCHEGEAKAENENHPIPEINLKIESLNDLLPNKTPSPLLLSSATELILVYCFVYRLYNGELKESALDVVDTLLQLSPILKSNYLYEDLESCLMQFVQRVKSSPSFKDALDPISEPFNDLLLILDSYSTVKIDNGKNEIVPKAILCFTDLHNVFMYCLQELDKTKQKDKEKKEKRKLYFKSTKKLCFMVSWVKEKQHTFRNLQASLKTAMFKIRDYWDNVTKEIKNVENHIHQLKEDSKVNLIEEI